VIRIYTEVLVYGILKRMRRVSHLYIWWEHDNKIQKIVKTVQYKLQKIFYIS